MGSIDNQKGTIVPEEVGASLANGQKPQPGTDDPYGAYDDGYPHEEPASTAVVPAAPSATSGAETAVAAPKTATGGGGKVPPPPPPSDSGGEEEDGMLRMSFLEHLEELRGRIFKALIGIAVAFVASLTFSDALWRIVSEPAVDALKQLHFTPRLVIITPMESFNILWVKLPVLAAIFLSSPWILYQVWAFIAPGLYRRERRWAAPFVISTAGLFIFGGMFAYFVAFRYGLTFLLGLGRGNAIEPMVTITEYFDLFVNVTLGIGLVFELPVLIFFLTLLHIASPRFLVQHSRYAILAIFIIAAIVTPTPDVFNLMLFATPMCLLFFVGVFASYLLVLHRENRRFPWKPVLYWTGVMLFVVAGVIFLAVSRYGYHLVPRWPFMTR
jgi:sec-independent protein translocase protein TatC